MKWLKKRIRRFTLISTLTSTCLIAVASARSSEPVYNGKPLSEWLYILQVGYTSTGEPVDYDTTREAIRQMGTNAIPTLLDILGATDRNKWWVLRRLKSPGFKEAFRNRNVSTGDLEDIGAQGFAILGTNAVSAIPKINKLFRNSESCSAAAKALAQLGPEGFAALTNALSDKNLVNTIVWTIGEKGGSDTQTITKILVGALKSPEWETRGSAAHFLAKKDATLAIPALIPMLDDSVYLPREGAAEALESYGPAAKAAIPKLLSLCTNNWNPMYISALRAIDRDTAGQAEAFIVNGGPLGVAGFGWSETKLRNGKVLIAGGFFQTTVPRTNDYIFSRAQIFDPTTGKREETGSMKMARWGHTATLLPNGKVLVAGGNNLGTNGKRNYLISAELYDPATEKWTEAGSMHSTHPNEQAVLQRDGKVRISGYIGDYQKRPADDLYDPATGTWTAVTNK